MATRLNDRNEKLYSAPVRVTGAAVTVSAGAATSIVFPKNLAVTVPVPAAATITATATGYTSPQYSWSYRFGTSGAFSTPTVGTPTLAVVWDNAFYTAATSNTVVQYKVSVVETAGILGVNAAEYTLSIPIIREATNYATVRIFKRTTTAVAPVVASTGTATYNFTSATLAGQPSGWSTAIPDESGGAYLWASELAVAGLEINRTIENSTWPAAVLYTRSGTQGTSTALVYAYKRSATAPTDNPGAVTFSFATGSISTAALLNSWSKTIPSGTDPLYVTTASAYSSGSTDDIAANEWSTAVKFVENGLNSATVFLYARNNSTTTAPAIATTGSATYTFSTAVLSGTIPANWTQTLPLESAGSTLWVISATASSTSATDTIANTEWSAARVLSTKGTDGGPGVRGTRQLYSASTAYNSTYQYNVSTLAGSASYAAKATELIAAAVSGSIPTTPITGDTVTFSNSVTSTFTGAIAGYVLTVTGITSGEVTIGQSLSGSGILAGTTVTGFISGTNSGAGTYAISRAQTAVSTTITATLGDYVYTLTYDGDSWEPPGTVIDGSLLVTGSITASKINANGLSIKDANGNTILAAGTALDFGNVGGPTKPADNATKNTTYTSSTPPSFANPGDFWKCTADTPNLIVIGATAGVDTVVVTAGQFIDCRDLKGSQDNIVLPFSTAEAAFSTVSGGVFTITKTTYGVTTGAKVTSGVAASNDYVYFTDGYTSTNALASFISAGTAYTLTSYTTAPTATITPIALTAYVANTLYRATGTGWETYSTVGANWLTDLSNRPKTFIVRASGLSATLPTGWWYGIRDSDSNAELSGAARSYAVYEFDRDGNRVFSEGYDIFGNGVVAGRNTATVNMADDLNYICTNRKGNILVIYTYDEPQSNRLSSGLPEAMYRCGASKAIFGSSNFRYRGAYILVGIAGCGEGNGAEIYAGDIPNDPNAWCEITFSIHKGSLNVSGMTGSLKSVKDLDYTGELNATLGANSSNLQVGLGVNTVANSNFLNGSLEGWSTDSYGGTADNWAFGSGQGGWDLEGVEGTAFIRQITAYMADWSGSLYATRVPVIPGKRYEGYAYTGAHRAQLDVKVAWYDSAGNWITENVVGTNDDAEEGGTTLGGYKKTGGFVYAPAGAANAMLFIRKYTTKNDGSGDSWAFITRAFFGEALAGQTELSPWSPGQIQGVRALGYSGELNATYGATASQVTAINSKLSKDTASILGATISINAVTGAGFRAGNLNWDADGTVIPISGTTYGKGVAMTPGGLVGHNGTKTTFAINATTGAATFSGDISASKFMTGAYTEWAWPAAGSSGSYLGSEGLLLGNYNNSKYFQVTSDGNVYAPGMKIENGKLTISEVDVINTVNIGKDQVTVPVGATLVVESSGDVLSIDINANGSPIWINFSGRGRVGTAGGSSNQYSYWTNASIVVDDVVLATAYGGYAGSMTIGCSTLITGGTSRNIKIRVSGSTSSGAIGYAGSLFAGATIFAIGVKR